GGYGSCRSIKIERGRVMSSDPPQSPTRERQAMARAMDKMSTMDAVYGGSKAKRKRKGMREVKAAREKAARDAANEQTVATHRSRSPVGPLDDTQTDFDREGDSEDFEYERALNAVFGGGAREEEGGGETGEEEEKEGEEMVVDNGAGAHEAAAEYAQHNTTLQHEISRVAANFADDKFWKRDMVLFDGENIGGRGAVGFLPEQQLFNHVLDRGVGAVLNDDDE
ncbi:hypothetical protein PFISCL1PPCAC_28921, partial [Pristionchus fissidentatus]